MQQDGPKDIAFFGTRNMGWMHQQLIEVLSYAMVLTVRTLSRLRRCYSAFLFWICLPSWWWGSQPCHLQSQGGVLLWVQRTCTGLCAVAPQGNHIYTSGATGTNAAVIRGALRAEKPELLTVVLPQSLSLQPPESQELLSEVG